MVNEVKSLSPKVCKIGSSPHLPTPSPILIDDPGNPARQAQGPCGVAQSPRQRVLFDYHRMQYHQNVHEKRNP